MYRELRSGLDGPAPLEPGITSATAVYGVRNRERIEVEITIAVEQPRSG